MIAYRMTINYEVACFGVHPPTEPDDPFSGLGSPLLQGNLGGRKAFALGDCFLQ